MTPRLVLGAPEWLLAAAILAGALILLTLWSYWRSPASALLRLAAASLKIVAVVALALCLLEPLYSGVRPRRGANLFVIAADNSQSLQLRDRAGQPTRAEVAARQLAEQQDWRTRLSQDFDVRRYLFDTQARPVADFANADFNGAASALSATVETIASRYKGRPMAGILLFTDGNATDGNASDWDESSVIGDQLPPIYPVVLGEDQNLKDLRIRRISVSQTNFEASPVTVLVEADCQGYAGERIVFQLLDDDGKQLQEQTLPCHQDEEVLVHRFLMRPDTPGISFFRCRVLSQKDRGTFDTPALTAEATLLNNERLVVVDRGGGPYRILYVSGRPNWEFKFLRRALHADPEIQLVGLVRIAKKEPKFTFRGHRDESTNPLFRGFGNQEDEEAERYDQPVMIRLGTQDAEELRDGFPKTAEELFRYHAIIVDDLEAEYFTQDQMSLIQEFVSQRGGGFVMLGGRDSFASGGYARTPVGELLPVYPHRATSPASSAGYRLALTREGWLQPWMRLRTNESDEKKRLSEMPPLRTLNVTDTIKPGATVLAHVETVEQEKHPALVVQRFGKGRSAALLLGDLWRWHLRRADPAESDAEKAWRQTVRWLIAEVPGRVDVEVQNPDAAGVQLEILVTVRDEKYEPLDNAVVRVRIETPEDQKIELSANPSDTRAGGYQVSFTPRLPGAYRVEVIATAPDGSEVARRTTGWAYEPVGNEFEALKPNLPLLKQLAEASGGEVLSPDQLPRFVSSLPNRKIPITEPWIFPLWHQWSVIALAISCLAGEWGLRRWKGLP